MGRSFNVKRLVLSAIFVALSVVATRLFSITTPVVRIGFGFVPVVIAAMYLGPVNTGIIGIIADLVGFFAFPSGVFFPGFTLTAFMSGFIYGVFFEGQKANKVANLIIGCIAVTLVCDMILNTLWLTMIANKVTLQYFQSRLMLRLPGHLIMLAVKIAFTILFSKLVYKNFKIDLLDRNTESI